MECQIRQNVCNVIHMNKNQLSECTRTFLRSCVHSNRLCNRFQKRSSNRSGEHSCVRSDRLCNCFQLYSIVLTNILVYVLIINLFM